MNDSGTCVCSECYKGYYLKDGKCTNEDVDNCLFLKPDITKESTCYACFVGYRWNATDKKCKLCSKDDVCVTSGCAALAYPGKIVPDVPAAANSTIIYFLVSTLIALATFLI